MSTSSASRYAKYLKKSGTFMATIVTPYGDLYQEYTDMGSGAYAITPDWASYSEKPYLEFVCISSRTVTGEVAISNSQIRWYMNDVEITFSGTTSTGVYAGLFSIGSSGGTTPRQRLVINKNLAEAAGYASCVIKAVATVVSGSQSDQLQATYTIKIQQKSGTSNRVTIVAGDSNNFVITGKSGTGSTCVLKAMTYQDGAELTSGLTYKWYKMTGTAWEQITGLSDTAQTYTVKEADIETYAEFKVEVFFNGSEDAFGQDTQGVMDASDPYMIQPNPTPSDETIEEGTGGTVVYAPKIVNRSTNAAIATQPLFDFVAMNAVGLIINSASGVSTFTVTETDCINGGGGDLTVVITSQDF
jgi:hypothetical protein